MDTMGGGDSDREEIIKQLRAKLEAEAENMTRNDRIRFCENIHDYEKECGKDPSKAAIQKYLIKKQNALKTALDAFKKNPVFKDKPPFYMIMKQCLVLKRRIEDFETSGSWKTRVRCTINHREEI